MAHPAAQQGGEVEIGESGFGHGGPALVIRVFPSSKTTAEFPH
jgi:hypothetical protein